MLKKTITYTDFNGQERTETHYFNLTEAELTELEHSCNGGLSQLLTQIVEEDDEPKLIEHFKKLILMSYGIKSPDGKYHTKNDRIREEFVSSMAYSELFMELSHDAEKAAEFVNGIMPKTSAKTAANIKALPAHDPAVNAMSAAAD